MRNFGVRLLLGAAVLVASLVSPSCTTQFFRRGRDRAVAAQAERTGYGAAHRGPPRRRADRGTGVLRARPAYAHGVSFADAGRGRPEPDRLRTGRAARHDPHAGTAGCAADRRRGAVLHPRDRFRIHAHRRRDAAEVGARPHSFGRGVGGPPLPAGRDSARLQRHAARRPRTAPDVGDSRQGGIYRGGRSENVSRTVEVRAAVAGEAAGAGGGLRRLRLGGGRRGTVAEADAAAQPPAPAGMVPPRARSGERAGGRYRLVQPHPGLFLRGTGGAQPQHASQPGHGRDAPSRRGARHLHRHRRTRPRRRICSTASTRRGTGCPAAPRSRRILDEAIRNYEPAHPEKAIPALVQGAAADRRDRRSAGQDQARRTG